MHPALPPLSSRRLLRTLGAVLACRPVLVWGPAGSGKTALIRELLAGRGLPVAECDLAELARRELPCPLDELLAGGARQAPRLTARARSVALLVTGFERADEVGARALASLLEGGRLGRYALPAGSAVLAEGRLEGGTPPALVPALQGRFLQLRLAPSAEDWLRWAGDLGLAPSIREHLEANPGHLLSSPGAIGPTSSPRSWHALAELWAAGQTDPEPLARGLLGAAHAEAFLARCEAGRPGRRQGPRVVRSGRVR